MTNSDKLQALMALAQAARLDYAEACEAPPELRDEFTAKFVQSEAALLSALEPLVADAERYRWLKANGVTPGQRPAPENTPLGYKPIRLRVDTAVYLPATWDADVDAAIDAARSAEPQAGSNVGRPARPGSPMVRRARCMAVAEDVVMPIKSENAKRYPADWKAIADSIRERAGQRCEKCGAPNHQRIARGGGDDDGTYMLDTADVFCAETGKHLGQCRMADYEVARMVDIVLTVAHLDHTPENCDPANLRAWCQRCHLRYDRAHHQANAQATRRAKAGQPELFP